jgi:pyruvate dehydrogenase E2 component (dihydrolipoamide acetyltransferase)
MPALGADMEAGTLVAWRRAPGDHLTRGEVYAEVETDKGVLAIETFEPGVLEACLVPVGTRVTVGTPIAVLRGEGADAPRPERDVEPPPVPPPPAPAVPTPALPTPAAPPRPAPNGRRASPRARHRAAELGVPLEGIAGTGPDGTIVEEDVERAAQRPEEEAARQRMRRAIAAAMERSNREIPHYWVSTQLDLAAASAWLTARNERRPIGERTVMGALFVRATARALRRVPGLNGAWSEGRFVPAPGVHVGLAIALRGGGLVTPAVRDADALDAAATMRCLDDVVGRAREGHLRASELSAPTITLTSLGERGVERLLPRIAPGQVAAVGFGRVVERPWVVDGALVVRPLVEVTLAGDHRATDGHEGAAFLTALAAEVVPDEAP